MSVYEIESGVPVPGKGRPPRYPFRSLQVGQSFFVAADDNWYSAKNAAYAFGLRHGLRFQTAQTEDGIRIWRVA